MTLGWCDTDGPLVFEVQGRVTTVIVRWTTTADGRLIDDREEPEGRVELWELSERAVQDLERIAEGWPLANHDLLLEDGRIYPCRDSLRHWPGFPRYEREAQALAEASSGVSCVG